jgi:hypothetical protein
MAKPGDIVVVDGQKLKIDGNGLRKPSNKEKLKGLPTSPADAKKQGLNLFRTKDGEVIDIRYKARQKPDQYGLSAEYEGYEKRKANRFGKGEGGKTKRTKAQKIATPDSKERTLTDKKMAGITAKGKAPHHNLPVSPYAKGKQEAMNAAAARGEDPVKRGKLFDQRMGLKKGAHSRKNIEARSHKVHDRIHNVEEPAVRKGIANAKKGVHRHKLFGGLFAFSNNGNGNGNGDYKYPKGEQVFEANGKKDGKKNGSLRIGRGTAGALALQRGLTPIETISNVANNATRNLSILNQLSLFISKQQLSDHVINRSKIAIHRYKNLPEIVAGTKLTKDKEFIDSLKIDNPVYKASNK